MESLFREFLLEINVKIEVKYFLKKIYMFIFTPVARGGGGSRGSDDPPPLENK